MPGFEHSGQSVSFGGVGSPASNGVSPGTLERLAADQLKKDPPPGKKRGLKGLLKKFLYWCKNRKHKF